jgi:hypothetical protein
MFDLIIPCLFNHFNNLPKILDSFKHQDLINRIIIVLNGINDQDYDRNILKKYKKKLKLIRLNYTISPGKAREKATRFSKSEYIVYHDADDEAHPDKLLILKYFFEKTNCDHILHLIQPIELNFLNYKDFNKINYIDTKKLIDFYYRNNKMDFGDIIGKRISQGLSAVRRSKITDIVWLNIKSGEDKDFNKKSLLKNNKMIVIDCYLSKYDKYKLYIMKSYHPKAIKDFNL